MAVIVAPPRGGLSAIRESLERLFRGNSAPDRPLTPRSPGATNPPASIPAGIVNQARPPAAPPRNAPNPPNRGYTPPRAQPALNLGQAAARAREQELWEARVRGDRRAPISQRVLDQITPSRLPRDRFSPALSSSEAHVRQRFNEQLAYQAQVQERWRNLRADPYTRPQPQAPLNLGQVEARARSLQAWRDRVTAERTARLQSGARIRADLQNALASQRRLPPARPLRLPQPRRIPAPGALARGLGGLAPGLVRALIPDSIINPTFTDAQDALEPGLSGPRHPAMNLLPRSLIPAEAGLGNPLAGALFGGGSALGNAFLNRLFNFFFPIPPAISEPPPQLAPPQAIECSFAILSREVRSNPNGAFSPLQTRIPSTGVFQGLVTFTRQFTQTAPATDGSYGWSDKLLWQDAVTSGEVTVYSGVIAGNQSVQPSAFYRTVRVIPYEIIPNQPTPQQLPDWDPTPQPIPPPYRAPTAPTVPAPGIGPNREAPPALQPPGSGQRPAIAPPVAPPALTPQPPLIPAGIPAAPGSPIGQMTRPPGRSASLRFPPAQATVPTVPPPLIPPSLRPGDPPVAQCRFRDDPYSQRALQQAQLNGQKLDQLMGLVGDAAILNRINSFETNMNNRLGPQLNGGLSGVIKNFARNNLVQSFLNTLTFITALHNAFMLSNNLRLTLFSAFDLIYELPGMSRFAPTDPETGERVDYGTWAADQFDSLMRAAFGDQTVDTVRTNWNKASRVYQAATNLLFAMQSIMWSIQEALEVVGQYVAWIGNALKKYGVVSERAYGWMNPQAANSSRFSRFYAFMNQANEQVENLEQIAGATLDVTESAAELTRQSNEFNNALRGLTTDGTQPDPNFPSELPYSNLPEPQPIVENEAAAAAAAQNQGQPIPPEQEQRQVNEQ